MKNWSLIKNDDIPIYDFNFYELVEDNCKYCRTEFYYLVDLEKE